MLSALSDLDIVLDWSISSDKFYQKLKETILWTHNTYQQYINIYVYKIYYKTLLKTI